MTRITISAPSEVAEKAEARADALNRSVSSYVSLLIADDLRAVGLMPNATGEDEAHFWAKAQAAAKKNPKIKSQIAELLPRSVRDRLRK